MGEISVAYIVKSAINLLKAALVFLTHKDLQACVVLLEICGIWQAEDVHV